MEYGPAVGRFLVIAVAGAMLLGACGGDDDAGSGGGSDSDAEAYVDAVAASIREDEEAPSISDEQATCMAEALVDVVGADTLKDAEVTPAEFADTSDFTSLDVDVPDDAADRLGADLRDCDLAGPIKDGLVDSFTSNLRSDLPDEAARCLGDHLDDEGATDGLAATFIDGSDEHLRDLLTSAVGACPSVETEILLAQAPSDLPAAAEACVRGFVEDNADLAAQAFTSGDTSATRELSTRLAAACPEAAVAFGG